MLGRWPLLGVVKVWKDDILLDCLILRLLTGTQIISEDIDPSYTSSSV